jgi:hypothetical protein
MEAKVLASLVHLSIFVPMLGWIIFRLWPQARRERFQQDLFEIRNDLLEAMWRNGFSCEEPAYIELRATINGAIRWAERLNVPALLVYALFSNASERLRNQDRAPLPEDARLREILSQAEAKMRLRFIQYLRFSWAGLVLMPCVRLYMGRRSVVTPVSQREMPANRGSRAWVERVCLEQSRRIGLKRSDGDMLLAH